MKTIGLIGGMSWESSALYYQVINKKVQEICGGLHSCECLMYSVDFAEIARLQHKGEWDMLSDRMVAVAKKLELAGADIILLCTNTMHKTAAAIESSIGVPFLHIVDATADAIQKRKHKRLGMIATKFSMEEDFLKSRYKDKFGIEIIIPGENDRDIIHHIIYEELVKGRIREESKQHCFRIIDTLLQNVAEGIISGCTEIELLVHQNYIGVDLFETTKIHAEKAVEVALQK